MKRSFSIAGGLWLCLVAGPVAAQYPWPVTPLERSQEITGTFCEYRDTGSAPHFHNGVDIPKPDGSPVYAVRDGRVTALSAVGANAFVRVENFAYVHIRPSAAISIGDSVFAGQTVLGTILPGQGHVHLTDGQPGSEQNALRTDFGLTPYDDPWPPRISEVQFFEFETGRIFPGNLLSGNVGIRFRVREANGPPTTSESRLNNGAYAAGYQVLSRDRKQVVYSPAPSGVQFRFDVKPSNFFVHNVFDPARSSTSRHVYIITNRLTRRDALDTAALPAGDYTIMLFAVDTRANADTVYLDVTIEHRDLLPPQAPVLLQARNQDGEQRLAFAGSDDEDLLGFRLYSSPDLNRFDLVADEGVLPAGASSHALPPSQAPVYFYLTAVDTVAPPNESERSDVYGIGNGSRPAHVLVVDGFDRLASWTQPYHWFAAIHGQAMAPNDVSFSSCANEALLDGDVALKEYDAVVWVLGDEGTEDETFSSGEQQLVRAYLEGGGKLFVTGSEIAWDLGANGSTLDQQFLRDYLKVTYAGDDAGSLMVRPEAGGIFDGLAEFEYGVRPYEEDFPDYFTPATGSQVALRYGNNRIASVQYSGTFGNGAEPGKLVIFGFPFETISSLNVRREIMARVLDFFFPDLPVAVLPGEGSVPQQFTLSQNYPNPFAVEGDEGAEMAGTSIAFALPQATSVGAVVYDVLGREVHRWPATAYGAGQHVLRWDGRNAAGDAVARGVYFLRMQTGDGAMAGSVVIVQTIKMHIR